MPPISAQAVYIGQYLRTGALYLCKKVPFLHLSALYLRKKTPNLRKRDLITVFVFAGCVCAGLADVL